VSSQAFDFQDLLQLVELMKSSSQFTEFKLRANGIELELRRGPPEGSAAPLGSSGVQAGEAARALPAPAPAPLPAPTPPSVAPSAGPVPAPSAAAREPAALPPAPAAAHVAAEGQAVVKAPMVGTVYLAPEPGARPFVTVGQEVDADTQVCIVEVMKLMNAIPAGAAGVVTQVLVGDAETVEYGQPLIVISPK
jgi:acetyl-CoA carboxylase biotin carboxyl carrier protein